MEGLEDFDFAEVGEKLKAKQYSDALQRVKENLRNLSSGTKFVYCSNVTMCVGIEFPLLVYTDFVRIVDELVKKTVLCATTFLHIPMVLSSKFRELLARMCKNKIGRAHV